MAYYALKAGGGSMSESSRVLSKAAKIVCGVAVLVLGGYGGYGILASPPKVSPAQVSELPRVRTTELADHKGMKFAVMEWGGKRSGSPTGLYSLAWHDSALVSVMVEELGQPPEEIVLMGDDSRPVVSVSYRESSTSVKYVDVWAHGESIGETIWYRDLNIDGQADMRIAMHDGPIPEGFFLRIGNEWKKTAGGDGENRWRLVGDEDRLLRFEKGEWVDAAENPTGQ